MFFRGHHGWSFNLERENADLLNKDDWQGTLTDERSCLAEVNVDTWGGWIFINMIGLKSRGFRGNLPNPYQERKVTNLHRNLAKYMGAGAPRPLE